MRAPAGNPACHRNGDRHDQTHAVVLVARGRYGGAGDRPIGGDALEVGPVEGIIEDALRQWGDFLVAHRYVVIALIGPGQQVADPAPERV